MTPKPKKQRRVTNAEIRKELDYISLMLARAADCRAHAEMQYWYGKAIPLMQEQMRRIFKKGGLLKEITEPERETPPKSFLHCLFGSLLPK